MARTLASALVLMAGAAIVAVVGAQGHPDADAALVRMTPAALAAQGRFPSEDRFVRDVYTRLMRYDLAARQFRRIENPNARSPEQLAVALSDINTAAWSGRGDLGVSAPDHGSVRLERAEFCRGDDPCHAIYDVVWRARGRSSAGPQSGFGDVTRVTKYRVTLTLGDVTRNYSAAVVYHDRDGETARAEILDPVIPQLNELSADRSPLAIAPWASYTKTRQYVAVIEKARDRLANPQSQIFSVRVPVGFLTGDTVTAVDRKAVMMATDVCAPPANCDCGPSGGVTDAKWTELRAAFPSLVRDRICKTGDETGTYNCLAWTIGDTSRWWWAEADANLDLKITTAEMNAFYQARGVSNIAYYGHSATDILHVAKKAGGSGSDCPASSKLGSNIRMSHDLNQLAGGDYRGIVGGR